MDTLGYSRELKETHGCFRVLWGTQRYSRELKVPKSSLENQEAEASKALECLFGILETDASIFSEGQDEEEFRAIEHVKLTSIINAANGEERMIKHLMLKMSP